MTAIKIKDVNISDELFCFMLDFSASYDLTLLRELSVENVSFSSNEKVCMKIRQFIEATRVKALTLNAINLKSR